ncbi:Flp pilus assembly protein CpaB [Marinobacter hydrocarbonoclasticus]|uniref:Flp pilus assembly protein CpaB n=1 Tax=Marinobacter nauticus TaxID=2743 RepID=UPI001C96759A|nr:Flp pilus assembly protein CpaB [Marinobacter nauticus]MBY6192856.1 Flp pilus assembly protein CpaB [Marinobacter nauticus]MBY6214004.1 Flp pilus assembly protein CpaB [Marinobacter nauticus]
MKSRFVYALPSVLLASAAVGLGLYGLLATPQSSVEPSTQVPSADAPAQEQRPSHTYSLVTEKVEAGGIIGPQQLLSFEVATEIPEAIPADSVPVDVPVRRDVRSGELLTTSVYESATRIQPLLDEGARAMALDLTPLSSVGGLVRPGDYVDIFGSFRGDGEDEPVSVELLRRVKVLAVQGATSSSEDPEGDSQRRNQTFVLSVPREQVPKLALASTEARLSFVGTNASEAESDEPLTALLSEIRPASSAPESELAVDASADESRPSGASKEPEGRKVQIFEGSAERSVYVQ